MTEDIIEDLKLMRAQLAKEQEQLAKTMTAENNDMVKYVFNKGYITAIDNILALIGGKN